MLKYFPYTSGDTPLIPEDSPATEQLRILDKLFKNPQFAALNETDKLYFLKHSNQLDARSYDILQRLRGWHMGMYFLVSRCPWEAS